ncbi:hypothetical protein IW967_02280 [Alicyclobacillus mali]|uniref:Lipoprotein n=1 Tax=Alicyclobacillus mali (ex Roth et al. 2021) TaxID=1123961 RepID=A0ABS0F094_9BACL|nr:hypothetical protein [Alicyclobacillus mali (ex Roth et al. 2021)]MBF8376705.1 hypothetical protein [Alicyclobacillus mali (ex Roth et al. 2021)]MCL6488890.1 hypothetical protein [Alicyclobacillus mali (ex Roth et al. 2021)]
MNRKSILYVLSVAAAAALVVTGCGTASSTNNTTSSGAASTAVAVKHDHKGASASNQKENKTEAKSSSKATKTVKSSVALTAPAAGTSVTAGDTLKVDGHVSSNLAKKDVQITLTNSEKKVLAQQIVGTSSNGDFTDTLKLPKDLGKTGAELTLQVSVVGESGIASAVTLHVK